VVDFWTSHPNTPRKLKMDLPTINLVRPREAERDEGRGTAKGTA